MNVFSHVVEVEMRKYINEQDERWFRHIDRDQFSDEDNPGEDKAIRLILWKGIRRKSQVQSSSLNCTGQVQHCTGRCSTLRQIMSY